jgi:hypothetical protein
VGGENLAGYKQSTISKSFSPDVADEPNDLPLYRKILRPTT